MNKKPTYEELEQRVRELDEETAARKQAEEALRKSEESYRSLLDDVVDSSEVGIFILNSDFRIVWVNQALERYFGLEGEEVVGKDKRQLIREQIKYKFEEPEVFAERVLAMYDNNTYVENFECHVIPNGERKERHLEHWSRPIQSGIYAGGRVELYYDVTVRKQAEEALRESEDRFRSIIENTEAGYFLIDKDGCFRDVNDAWLGMHRYSSRDEVIGQHFSLTQIDTDLKAANENVKKLFEGEPLPSGEFSRRCKDGLIGYHTFTVSPVIRGGEIIGLEGFIIDSTEKKRLEAQLQQAQKMEAIGTLAGGIAHDFNNLLSVILGNIALAESDVKTEVETSVFLKKAKKASMRAKDLTARLITFSRGGEPVKKVASIGELVKDSVNSTLSGSDIYCEFSIPSDLRPVEMDEGQMKQVIYNIVINAQEAMAGKGAIKVYCEDVTIEKKDAMTLKDGKYVKISIKDQGTGIPEENLPKIFDPYFSTKEMGTRKGMGLGLSTCYSVVEKHNGLITVESEPGLGTILFIYLPASEKEITEPEPVKEPVPEIPVIGKRKILVMDDEKMIRHTASHILNRLGYDVELSKDGAEAIEIYKKAKESGEPFDAVILDLTNQFGMGGIEAIQKLLEIDPDVKGIVSTGYSNDPVVTKFWEYGFRGALTKPYTIDELSKALGKVVSGE